jgi:hypothetical protein
LCVYDGRICPKIVRNFVINTARGTHDDDAADTDVDPQNEGSLFTKQEGRQFHRNRHGGPHTTVTHAQIIQKILLYIIDSDFKVSSLYNIGNNKCKELLPTKLQFEVDKNPTWHGSWMLLDALFIGPTRKGSMWLPK